MAHTLIGDPAGEAAAQPGAVASKVVHRSDGLNVTVFGFDAGEQLTEHQQPAPLWSRSCPDGTTSSSTARSSTWFDGSWLHMAPGAPHSLVAIEPSVMLLTLFGSEARPTARTCIPEVRWRRCSPRLRCE